MALDSQSANGASDLLDRYCARIGFRGDRSPSLSTIRKMHLQHVTAIPFENIDVLLKKPISLGVDALSEKLVTARRGGYCFEQNSLFRAVLEALGLSVTALAGRAIWNVPDGVRSPRTHMLLAIEIEREIHIADVGYGRLTLPEPVRLALDHEQVTSCGSYRIVSRGSGFQLEALIEANWTPLYCFSMGEELQSDLEVANWYASTHPRSIFTSRLIMSRSADECCYALLDNRLSIYRKGGLVERRIARSPNQLATILCDYFSIENLDSKKVIEMAMDSANEETEKTVVGR